MSTIASLLVDLAMKTASFDAGAAKARGSLKNIEAGVGSLASTMNLLKGVGAAVGVGLGLREIGATIATVDEASKAARRFGMSLEDLTRLQYVGDIMGVAGPEVTANLAMLTRRLGEVAATGKGELAGALTQLGLTARDLIAGGSVNALSAIADAMQAVPDPAQKAALAVDLFGRSGMGMLSMLEEGSAGIRRFAAESDDFGRTIATEFGRHMEEAADTMTRFEAVVGQAKLGLASMAVGFLDLGTFIVGGFKTPEPPAINWGPSYEQQAKAMTAQVAALDAQMQHLLALDRAGGFKRLTANFDALFASVSRPTAADPLRNMERVFQMFRENVWGMVGDPNVSHGQLAATLKDLDELGNRLDTARMFDAMAQDEAGAAAQAKALADEIGGMARVAKDFENTWEGIGETLTSEVLTDLEKTALKMNEIQTALALGVISPETWMRQIAALQAGPAGPARSEAAIETFRYSHRGFGATAQDTATAENTEATRTNTTEVQRMNDLISNSQGLMLWGDSGLD